MREGSLSSGVLAFAENHDQVLTKHANKGSQHTPANRFKNTHTHTHPFTIYIQVDRENPPTKKQTEMQMICTSV